MAKFQYSVGDRPDYHTTESRYDVPTKKTLLDGHVYVPGAKARDWEIMAEACAEDYHSNHDGWEASWPVELRLYEDGTEVARLIVECEHQPAFSVRTHPDVAAAVAVEGASA